MNLSMPLWGAHNKRLQFWRPSRQMTGIVTRADHQLNQISKYTIICCTTRGGWANNPCIRERHLRVQLIFLATRCSLQNRLKQQSENRNNLWTKKTLGFNCTFQQQLALKILERDYYQANYGSFIRAWWSVTKYGCRGSPGNKLQTKSPMPK